MSLDELRRRWPVHHTTVGGHAIDVLRTDGGGLPVLWLPGAVGTVEMFVDPLLAWGARRTMVAVGYPALVDPQALAVAVLAAADAMSIERFDLVGTSLGGHVAQWVAAQAPARVGRLVLGNTFHDPAPMQSPERRAALEARDADALKAETVARIDGMPDSPLKRLQQALVGPLQPAGQLRARMLAVQSARRPPPLQVPDDHILVLDCDDDPLVPPPVRAALRDAYPRARHRTIAGGGHFPYVLRADDYRAAVGAFLDLEPGAPR